jgi:hypothetical protein
VHKQTAKNFDEQGWTGDSVGQREEIEVMGPAATRPIARDRNKAQTKEIISSLFHFVQ